jgi:hypothetical protein
VPLDTPNSLQGFEMATSAALRKLVKHRIAREGHGFSRAAQAGDPSQDLHALRIAASAAEAKPRRVGVALVGRAEAVP